MDGQQAIRKFSHDLSLLALAFHLLLLRKRQSHITSPGSWWCRALQDSSVLGNAHWRVRISKQHREGQKEPGRQQEPPWLYSPFPGEMIRQTLAVIKYWWRCSAKGTKLTNHSWCWPRAAKVSTFTALAIRRRQHQRRARASVYPLLEGGASNGCNFTNCCHFPEH